jgi:putative ABC transport system permease protein
VKPGTNVVTVHPGDLRYANVSDGGNEPIQSVQVVDLPAYTSSPTSFITPAGLRRAGWQPRRAGWLIEMGQPLTWAQFAAARDMAAAAGLTIEAGTTRTSCRPSVPRRPPPGCSWRSASSR